MITTAMQLLATEIPTVDAIKLEQNEKSLQTLNLLTLAQRIHHENTDGQIVNAAQVDNQFFGALTGALGDLVEEGADKAIDYFFGDDEADKKVKVVAVKPAQAPKPVATPTMADLKIKIPLPEVKP